MRRLGTPRARRGRARGVAFTYFALIALPVLCFGAGLATDFTRIVIAGRQVANATEAAALSGAQQFTPGQASIDPTAAVTAAQDTYCVAQAAGQLAYARPSGPGQPCRRGGGIVTIDVIPVATGFGGGATTYTEVKVTARYQVHGLVFTGLFGQASSFQADPVTRSAALCLPGASTGPTNGYCAHPQTSAVSH